MDEFLLTGDRSRLGLISVYSHALFFGLWTRAVVLLLLFIYMYEVPVSSHMYFSSDKEYLAR